LIDEDALIDGLRSGRIRHAGLDVFHAEPLRPDHPIAAMDNITLTAHAGFRTLRSFDDAAAPRDRHCKRHRPCGERVEVRGLRLMRKADHRRARKDRSF
jgi:phosphoglycerate dehydrogenase-like enzyme